MMVPPRWALGLGAIAALACGVLAAIAASTSERSSFAAPVTGTGRPAAVGPVPAARSSTAPIEIPGIPAGPRRTSIEKLVLPLLQGPRLRAGVFGLDLRTGSFFDLLGDQSFAAASLIKIPIAVALLAEVDRGTISPDELLELRADQVATGSGALQYQPVGSAFKIGRLAERMIRKSDNTATNMLVDRLGGTEAVNRVFALWGLSQTWLRSPLPDLEGSNRTSPRDLVTIIGRAVGGGMLAPGSRDLLLSWMRRTHVRSLLPSGVGPGSVVANKTGDIPCAIGDAGYVETSGGDRYLLAIQVERPRNSARAKELIRRVSRVVYESLTGRAADPGAAAGHARSTRS